jgi:diguanylate cyclase (GGDEF)-like protein
MAGAGDPIEDAARLRDENEALKTALSDARVRMAELEQLADTDTLVPLPNRRAFVREVDRAIQQVRRYGTPAALLYIDLVGLKGVNDAHGHPAGDAMLLHVARTLKASLRATDFIARIGGDEFGLLLNHLDEAAARAKAEALVTALALSPLDLGRVTVKVEISAGLAMVRADYSAEIAIARADAAMYAARAAYRSAK